MAILEWGAPGQRFFESGIDRGVLYPKSGGAVPWSGLMSVDESSDGGGPSPFYSDGYKYLNVSTAEEFKAKITAFSSPPEFDVCDGTAQMLNGLFITQQRREEFGFSYRTLIGNDIFGPNYGYKIHLVYNALASPTTRSNKSSSASSSPLNLSWDITARPPEISGYRPTAHFMVDSRYTPPALLNQIEDAVYGTEDANAYLPDISELVEIFNSQVNIQLLKEQVDGQFMFESTPAIRRRVRPKVATGQKVLWLDVSNPDYAKLTMVTGD